MPPTMLWCMSLLAHNEHVGVSASCPLSGQGRLRQMMIIRSALFAGFARRALVAGRHAPSKQGVDGRDKCKARPRRGEVIATVRKPAQYSPVKPWLATISLICSLRAIWACSTAANVAVQFRAVALGLRLDLRAEISAFLLVDFDQGSAERLLHALVIPQADGDVFAGVADTESARQAASSAALVVPAPACGRATKAASPASATRPNTMRGEPRS